MKRFVCTVCGYIYEGVNAPQECPICHQSGEKFKETSLDSSEANTTYSKIKEGACFFTRAFKRESNGSILL